MQSFFLKTTFCSLLHPPFTNCAQNCKQKWCLIIWNLHSWAPIIIMPDPTWPMIHNSWTTLYFHSPRKKLPSTSIHHTPSLIEPYCWQMAEMLTWRRVVLLILVLFATMVGSWLYQLWEALPPNGVSAAVPSIFINTTIILFETMVLKFWATLTIQY